MAWLAGGRGAAAPLLYSWVRPWYDCEFVRSHYLPTLPPVVNKQCDRLAIEFKEASCSPPPPLSVPGGGVALGDEAGR